MSGFIYTEIKTRKLAQIHTSPNPPSPLWLTLVPFGNLFKFMIVKKIIFVKREQPKEKKDKMQKTCACPVKILIIIVFSYRYSHEDDVNNKTIPCPTFICQHCISCVTTLEVGCCHPTFVPSEAFGSKCKYL